MKNVATIIFVTIGALVAIFGLTVLGILVRGFVLLKLWAWFVVPIFGLKPLGLAAAIGLGALANYAAGISVDPDSYQDKDGKIVLKPKKSVALLVAIALSPFFILLIGYIAKSFM